MEKLYILLQSNDVVKDGLKTELIFNDDAFVDQLKKQVSLSLNESDIQPLPYHLVEEEERKMLRVAARRLSSLPWRSTQATSSVVHRSHRISTNDHDADDLSSSRSVLSPYRYSFTRDLIRGELFLSSFSPIFVDFNNFSAFQV